MIELGIYYIFSVLYTALYRLLALYKLENYLLSFYGLLILIILILFVSLTLFWLAKLCLDFASTFEQKTIEQILQVLIII